MRKCTRCGVRKPTADFWPGARRCTECVRTWVQIMAEMRARALPVHEPGRWTPEAR